MNEVKNQSKKLAKYLYRNESYSHIKESIKATTKRSNTNKDIMIYNEQASEDEQSIDLYSKKNTYFNMI